VLVVKITLIIGGTNETWRCNIMDNGQIATKFVS